MRKLSKRSCREEPAGARPGGGPEGVKEKRPLTSESLPVLAVQPDRARACQRGFVLTPLLAFPPLRPCPSSSARGNAPYKARRTGPEPQRNVFPHRQGRSCSGARACLSLPGRPCGPRPNKRALLPRAAGRTPPGPVPLSPPSGKRQVFSRRSLRAQLRTSLDGRWSHGGYETSSLLCPPRNPSISESC